MQNVFISVHIVSVIEHRLFLDFELPIGLLNRLLELVPLTLNSGIRFAVQTERNRVDPKGIHRL